MFLLLIILRYIFCVTKVRWSESIFYRDFLLLCRINHIAERISSQKNEKLITYFQLRRIPNLFLFVTQIHNSVRRFRPGFVKTNTSVVLDLPFHNYN